MRLEQVADLSHQRAVDLGPVRRAAGTFGQREQIGIPAVIVQIGRAFADFEVAQYFQITADQPIQLLDALDEARPQLFQRRGLILKERTQAFPQ